MLEVDALSVRYGPIRALEGLSLTVAPGEIVALVGANGAGKTTAVNAIAGLLPCRGRVRFQGRDIANEKPHRIADLGIRLSPEGREVFPELTVEENLRLGGFSLRKGALAGELERVYGLFPRLRGRKRQAAGTLSGGEQQMLALGRALMGRPKLLLLDEPSMGLSPQLTERVFGLLDTLRRQGTGILLIEENAKPALALADRAYVLETGRVVASGEARALREDPRVRRAYLGT